MTAAPDDLPEYRRQSCPVCAAVCEQRRRSVVLPDGEKRIGYDCIECESVYVLAEPVTLEEKVRL